MPCPERTAASMNSIPASAAYVCKEFSAGPYKMEASVSFIPRYSYSARSKSFMVINRKEASAQALLTNGQYTQMYTVYSENSVDDAVVTIMNYEQTNWQCISRFYSQEAGWRQKGNFRQDYGRTDINIY